MHSLMLSRQGQVLAEGWWAPYRSDAVQLFYSLSKSFTSTAVGFAVTEGKLKLDDRVTGFFPERLPAKVSDNLAALRVQDLLTMSVGRAADSAPQITKEDDWVKAFLALPIEHAPGSVFLYDSGATYMLSAILQQVTRQKLVDYLRPRLYSPLGIDEAEWAVCPRGINVGGWGMSATTDSLRKFGQFYLQKGAWNGKQLLPANWIAEATRFHIQQPAGPGQDLASLKQTSDWHQGYGYQFWRCRHGAFRGDGAFGQFCIMLPQHDAVVAITSNTLDMQGLIDLVWQHLLPGLHDRPLPEDAKSAAQLRDELAALTQAPPDGLAVSGAYTGTKTYALEANALGLQRASLRFDATACHIELHAGAVRHTIDCGIRRWINGKTDLPGTPPEFTELLGRTISRHPVRIAAAGAWKDANTFAMQWRYFETPHSDKVTCRFSPEHVEIEFLNSITQQAPARPETRPVLKGRLES